MKLEKQLAELSKLGLWLDEGIAVDDLLHSFGRDAYEKRPFDLVLFVLGIEVEREPWGRSVCSRVWNFDTECICDTGDYASIVGHLCKVASAPDRLTNVSDFVDIDSGKAWLKYTVNGRQRNWTVRVNEDWVDALTITNVMNDIERDGRRFYFKDNGQSMILFYLDARTAEELNKLSDNALKPVLTATSRLMQRTGAARFWSRIRALFPNASDH